MSEKLSEKNNNIAAEEVEFTDEQVKTHIRMNESDMMAGFWKQRAFQRKRRLSFRWKEKERCILHFPFALSQNLITIHAEKNIQSI
ncbi:hypothetical protein [Clostridium sp. AM58-1XD]|uniref:hypothetical protein n=1 Tax=Clostridium sp. AM58-1XD TaxID=2292307 RepID=UPI001FA8E121|nr:hypothetical protein [Clostridium sp. AM58-1XD]